MLYILQQAVDDIIFPRIMDATNAKDVWSTLLEEFKGSDKVRAIKLQILRISSMVKMDSDADFVIFDLKL